MNNNKRNQCLGQRVTNNQGQTGVIVDYVNCYEVHVKFDATGWVGRFEMGNITSGKLKDKLSPSVYGVGYIGDGEHVTSKNNKRTHAYIIWYNMLKRCYCPKNHKKQPTYAGCTVAEEWHNFQNFAEWHEANYPKDGGSYDLDKDALVTGNKEYGPSTCRFLTHQQNTEASQAKHYWVTSPKGEQIKVFNLKKFCRENDLNAGVLYQVAQGNFKHHKGWTAPKQEIDDDD